jgi:hypothetical protein
MTRRTSDLKLIAENMEKVGEVIRAARINPNSLPSNLRYRRGPQPIAVGAACLAQR